MIDSDEAAAACNNTLKTVFSALEDASMTLCHDIMEQFAASMGDDIIDRVDTFASDRGLVALKILLPEAEAVQIHKRAKVWADLTKLVTELDEVIEVPPTLANDIVSDALSHAFPSNF
jgi:hypothetical protein